MYANVKLFFFFLVMAFLVLGEISFLWGKCTLGYRYYVLLEVKISFICTKNQFYMYKLNVLRAPYLGQIETWDGSKGERES